MNCPYADKGCAKAETCTNVESNCALAKYFDFLVVNSKECHSNLLRSDVFVTMWKNRTRCIEKCECSPNSEESCRNLDESGFCKIYQTPAVKWPAGDVSYTNRCPMSTHIKPETKKGKKINALKASKRNARRR